MNLLTHDPDILCLWLLPSSTLLPMSREEYLHIDGHGYNVYCPRGCHRLIVLHAMWTISYNVKLDPLIKISRPSSLPRTTCKFVLSVESSTDQTNKIPIL